MKTLKFTDELSKKIISGEKTATWRLFDDKDLKAGEFIALVNSETNEQFAMAKITQLYTKTLGAVTDGDYAGTSGPKPHAEMMEEMRGYYGDQVNLDTEVKILSFVLD